MHYDVQGEGTIEVVLYCMNHNTSIYFNDQYNQGTYFIMDCGWKGGRLMMEETNNGN